MGQANNAIARHGREETGLAIVSEGERAESNHLYHRTDLNRLLSALMWAPANQRLSPSDPLCLSIVERLRGTTGGDQPSWPAKAGLKTQTSKTTSRQRGFLNWLLSIDRAMEGIGKAHALLSSI